MESALFATGEQFAQEARQCALRRDESGDAWDVRDVCADGERGDGEWAEKGWRHRDRLAQRCGKATGVAMARAVLTNNKV